MKYKNQSLISGIAGFLLAFVLMLSYGCGKPEAYEPVSPKDINFALGYSSSQMSWDHDGNLDSWAGTWTKLSADGIGDVDLATDKIIVQEHFAIIKTKKFGLIRVESHGPGSAVFWLKPSQREALLKLKTGKD